ncbi:universal stress protein [Deinococcus cellulosilyticus]|uniref:Universal stress protein n=1 Tax=Deinococcus cellulosilyticus (strain DSM 18568 / NBRC 106333 / KACC 11606 / 5516J-15) TaxID=1223518 RepID=A0A511N9L7_DEIC1|nr:universal stress protein [Deinococcus cellulosilyticus]GEM49071.1 universal stress protein [Deinococcus cellulosilyticus NBRC 106333 = KACC 11606]
MTRIMVPTDFSASAHKALKLAREMVPDARIKLVHVFDASAAFSPYVDALSPAYILEETQDRIKEAALENLKGIQAEGEDILFVMGRPADEILKAAKDFAADYIFMGTHGRKGLSHFFFGSVAEAVVRASPIPVMIVRDPE